MTMLHEKNTLMCFVRASFSCLASSRGLSSLKNIFNTLCRPEAKDNLFF